MHPEHQRKTHELIDLYASNLKIETERLYRSGAIEPDDYDPEYFYLAKVLLTAAIRRTQDFYSPIHNKALLKEINDLCKF